MTRSISSSWRGLTVLLLCTAVLWNRPTLAQNIENPVYVDDSTLAADAMIQARARLAANDPSEAARLVQRGLAGEGDRLLATPDDPNLFVTARERLIEFVQSEPALLARMRELFEPEARALLDKGQESQVANAYFLTDAGFDAVLRLAERRLEAAQFDAAWRTLARLDIHPDFTDARADRARRLLERIVRYTDARGGRNLLGRWNARFDDGRDARPTDPQPADPGPAEPGAAGVRGPIKPPDLHTGRSTLDPGPPITLAELVARPLASRKIPSALPADPSEDARRSPRAVAGRRTPLNYILPTVTNDLIYINDGYTLSAWERFTLLPIWRHDYGPGDAQIPGGMSTTGRSAIEDLATLAVSGRWAIAVGGIATGGQRRDDELLHAVDALTGAARWTARLAELDPSLAEGSFRGMPIIDQGVVAVGVTKSVKERRLLSFSLVGLDVATGATRWIRRLGSSGTLPYGAVAKVAEQPTLADGVVYQLDTLGFLGAVDIVTGQTLWLRRLPLQNILTPARPTWQGGSVVIHDGLVYAIAPDTRSVLALDAESGVFQSTRASAEFRNPEYLLRAGEWLIAAADDRITAISFADFASPETTPTIIFDARSTRIDGRVATAGSSVLVPTPDGVYVIRADATNSSATTLAPLDHSGNLVAMESELVVADESELHTYLLWDVAERILTDRMNATPDDPAPAATFVDLAYRAGRPGRIMPAVDAALNAIELRPMDDHNRQVRGRLFDSLWSIITEDPARADAPALTRELRGDLIDRLGRAAASPEERVRHLLALGSHEESGENPAGAVDAYQRILDTPALASTRFTSGGILAEADLEAAKGLTRIVRRFGAESYRLYEADAQRALASLGESTDPDAYASLARQYPVSASAAQAWFLAAERYARRGQTRRSLAALEDGLSAADNALLNNPVLVGEIAGRLITSLIEHGRLESAATALNSIEEHHPHLVLLRHGKTLVPEQLRAQVREQLAAVHRLPRLGPLLDNPPTQLLTDWRVERPLLDTGATAATESVILRSAEAIALWRINPSRGLRETWRFPVTPSTVLIASTWDMILILEPGAAGATFSRLDRATGARLWRSEALSDFFPPIEPNRPSPEGRFMAMDRRTLAMVQTDGRAAGFDLQTGERLWTAPRLLPVVADIDADADSLLVAGDRIENADNVPGLEPAPTAVAVDIRTGQIIKQLELPVGSPRWVRLTGNSLAIIGGDQGILGYDLLRDRQVWIASELAGVRTLDAWAFTGRVLVLDAEGGLWQISLGDNRPAARPIDTHDKLARTVLLNQPIRWAEVDAGVILASGGGILALDSSGAVIGMDRRGDDISVLAAGITRDRIATVAASPAFIEDGAKWHDLFIFSAPDGSLLTRRLVELNAPPEDITLLDGRILITAGAATLIIDANPE